MSKVLIDVLMQFLRAMVSTFLGPLFMGLDSMIQSLGLTSYVELFNSVLYSYIAPLVGFFFEFLGPLTISVLCLEFLVFTAYYGITMTTTWILKVLALIKKFPLA